MPSPTPAALPAADAFGAPSRAPEPGQRPRVMVRFLTLAIAALLTANGVILAEQASGRDLITLGRDGVDNAREAIADLLDRRAPRPRSPARSSSRRRPPPGPGRDHDHDRRARRRWPRPRSRRRPPARRPPPRPPRRRRRPRRPARAAPTGATWPTPSGPTSRRRPACPFKGAVPVVALDGGAFNDRLNAVRLEPGHGAGPAGRGHPQGARHHRARRQPGRAGEAPLDRQRHRLLRREGQRARRQERPAHPLRAEDDRPRAGAGQLRPALRARPAQPGHARRRDRRRLGQPRRGRGRPDRGPVHLRPAREGQAVGPGRAAAPRRAAAEGPARLRPRPVRLPVRVGAAVRRGPHGQRRGRPRSTAPSRRPAGHHRADHPPGEVPGR